MRFRRLTTTVCRVACGLIACWFGTGRVVEAVDFPTEVEPILQAHCIECHGEETQEGRLRLDLRASMLLGGDSGEPAIVPNAAADSYLLKLVRHLEPGKSMPPDGTLTDSELMVIERWIEEGAVTPAEYGPDRQAVALEHWSFLPLPEHDPKQGIDHWVRRRLRDAGLSPSPTASRQTLIRRLFLTMHGLPPTPEQVELFLRDERPEAWRELVDQVLASPHYGERLASLWLDLVRFGETNGFETNRERPTAWHYRDWVISAFNQDMPYDDFVRYQIAGDAVGDAQGTGFLVAGPVDIVKGQDAKLNLIQRMNELDDMINATGTTFLGLTTGCARCHNHKFDPISQRDYYALQAVFAGVEHADGTLPLTREQEDRLHEIETETNALRGRLKKYLPQAREPTVKAAGNVEQFSARPAKFVRFTILNTNQGEPCIDELQVFANEQNVALASLGAVASSSGDFQHELHRLEHINDGEFGNARSWISAQRQGGWVQIELAEVAEVDRVEWARDRLGHYGDRLATEYRLESSLDSERWELLASSADRLPYGSNERNELHAAIDGLSGSEAEEAKLCLEQLESLEAELQAVQSNRTAWIGQFRQPGQTYRLYRGEPDAPREPVGPDAISAFTSLNLPAESAEQQRRVALAKWIASPDNPLTARVIVNRLWQFHFGVGIVDTPSDFGANGSEPTHPELLDWLAGELIESGWSLKHIQRLILLSDTWRQDNRPHSQGLSVDAGSRLLWRFPPRRLEAEGIRDSVLAVSGSLQTNEHGGPGFSAFEVELENVRHYHPKNKYGPEEWRRMVYMTKVRQERDAVFGVFDCPDGSMVVAQRSRSTTPLQALNLLNSPFVNQQAQLLAQRAEKEAADQRDQVRRVWELCYQRQPTDEELETSMDFVAAEGLVQFSRAVLNSNEFVFIP